MILAVSATGPVHAQGGPVKGDLNGDGKVAVPDAVAALQFAIGLKKAGPNELAAADVNGDGNINIQDVILLLRAAVGLAQIPNTPPVHPVPPPGKDIVYNVRYEAGTRLQQQQVGVSFVIPKDWFGGVGEKDPTFLLGANGRQNTGGFVSALATGPKKITMSDITLLLSQSVTGVGNVVFVPDGVPKVNGNRASNTYTAKTPIGNFVGINSALLSDHGNAIMFTVYGPEKEKDYLPGVLNEMTASAGFTPPRLDNWLLLIAGSKFRLESGAYDPGTGAGTGAGSTSTSRSNNTFLEFCPSMAFNYESVGYVSVGDSVFDSEVHKKGEWGIALDMLNASAVLVPDDGSAWMTFRLGLVGDTVLFNGNDAVRFAANGCG